MNILNLIAPCILVDIDGTLAIRDPELRGPYEFEKLHLDTPNFKLIRLISIIWTRGTKIVYVSGRPEKWRDGTTEWINKHMALSTPTLFMRQDGDYRNDAIVKEEIYKQHIERSYEVIAVFDDRKRVVNKWRELDLLCCQVADNDD